MANQNTLADLSTTPASNLNFKGQSIRGTAVANTIDTMFQNEASMLKAFYDSLGGVATVSGTDTYTVTITEDWAAYASGLILAVKIPNANTGAATLNVTVPTAGALGAKAIRRQGDTALSANDMLGNGIYLLRYASSYNTTGAWILLNPAASSTVTDISSQLVTPINLSFAASVGSSALTISLKGVDGNDPSSTNKVIIPFRNVTAATGTMSYLTITAATSIVISSGSTMGFTSAVAGRLWIVGFNDGGTFRLGLVNALSGTSIMALRHGIYSSTAEGGAGAADSAQVIYTGTAVTSKAMTVLGYIEATEATAGTWATAPSLVKVLQPGDPLPGDTVQCQPSELTTSATGTTVIPLDNTIPQNTEGDQFMSVTITPTSAVNMLTIEHEAGYTNSAINNIQVALFQDSTANAIAAVPGMLIGAAGNQGLAILKHYMKAGTASSTTLKIRAGGNVAGTTRFNGFNTGAVYGGVAAAILTVTEIMA
jgi:hypothetical protein